MSKSPPLLVFSDLDGTLLDHDTYSWDAAKPALAALRDAGAGVILASSKTGAEMRVIRDQMHLTEWPAIVENGAGLLRDEDADPDDYTAIRAAIETAPQRECYRGFGDMTVAEVAEVTGLPTADAERAKTRVLSEPGLWSGSLAQKSAFLNHLAYHGISAREGGRFLTLSMGKTKASQMDALIATFKPKHTVALGDAPNDVEMLERAEFGVIVANPHRGPLDKLEGEVTGHITRTTTPGPAGWNAAILKLLAILQV